MALTLKRVAKLMRSGEPGRHLDKGGERGLYLIVTGPNAAHWELRYQINGRGRWMGLGSARTFNLLEARERARVARQKLADKIDPLELRRVERAQQAAATAGVITFHEAAAGYIAAHRAKWRSAKHGQQWIVSLQTYVHPLIGNHDVAAIDTPAIAPVIRHAAVPYREMSTVMAALGAREGITFRAVEFLILTAARVGEAVGATWDEINFDTATWSVPAVRMKGGKQHAVPLSDAAIALLKSLPREDGNLYLFIGSPGAAISVSTVSRTMRRLGRSETLHGFRSAFSDWAHEQTNFHTHEIEMSLAHTIGSAVEIAYRRGQMLAKRRRLMEAWAEYCRTPSPLAQGDNIVSIGGA